MENMPQTPPTMESQCKTTPTPPPVELRKPVTPDHLKLPKPFKYPERYVLIYVFLLDSLTQFHKN